MIVAKSSSIASWTERGSVIMPSSSVGPGEPEPGIAPVHIAYSTTPNEYRSLRCDPLAPNRTSGAMNRSLPFKYPVWVRVSRSANVATPKSISFALPRWETTMLDGLTSRCTT